MSQKIFTTWSFLYPYESRDFTFFWTLSFNIIKQTKSINFNIMSRA